MRITYDKDVDALYIEISEKKQLKAKLKKGMIGGNVHTHILSLSLERVGLPFSTSSIP